MARARILEREFESNLCEELSERGWTYESDGNPQVAGWDVGLALVPGDVLAWLSGQYPDEFEKAIPTDLAGGSRRVAERKLLEHVTRELKKATRMDINTGRPVGGLLGVLRNGFTFAQSGRPAAKFGPMMEFPPANPDLTSVVEASDAVNLRIMRQVRFDTATNETLDVVLTANGIPVVTMELKTDNTQTVNHAIKQYKDDRKPGRTRPLLAPGRVLVHFAVSNDLVYMTTKLEGEKTKFLPFNQGDNGHEGNPPSPTGSATNYLWHKVLARPMFMRIVKNFALYQPSDKGHSDARLIFPRFHQLRAVERIVEDIDAYGPGRPYLVWHSAGSGKTKTIAWLAHRLIRHMNERSESTFDSVIVVTDRKVLDDNIRKDIHLVESSKGLVYSVGEKSGAKSPQLKKALIEGNHIITTTLQTFPEVMKLIGDTQELQGRNWAVVADEAHSSQSGSAARDLRRLLVNVDFDEDEDISAEDFLALQDSAIAKSSNITFIALTATPKAKTLRLFGTRVGDLDEWEAFDTYTMAQAIEEAFILDVLRNYSTYDMFARVASKLNGDAEEILVDTSSAVTNIVRFARLHPTSIAQKAQVVVEHFRRNVLGLLDGTAKAMVVTSSRRSALHWYEKMNQYIARKGYEDMKTLVAFSGSLTDDFGDTVTEASLNKVPDTATAFSGDDMYKILIVADKFQTGFDEPRLTAMYVDKKLSGITTVQTLSRLNRIFPDKPDPMVLDFVNSPETVVQDFKRYYSDARITKDVDPQALYDLAVRLDTAGFYTKEEMEAVAAAYIDDAKGEEISRLVTPIKKRWQGKWRQAQLKNDKATQERLLSFRSDCISYRNAWQFLSQIIDYQDIELHQLAVLTTLLARNLHTDGDDYEDDYMQGVALVGVKLAPSAIEEDHSLTEGTGKGLPVPVFGGERHGMKDPEKGSLEEAIDLVNALLGANGANVSKASVAGFVTAFWGVLEEDETAVAMAKHNTPDQLRASQDFSDAVAFAVLRARQEADEIQSYMNDPDFLAKLIDISADTFHAQFQVEETTANE